MPNWMENHVQITGPAEDIGRFCITHINNDEDGELQLDFNSIIPMPTELEESQSGLDPYIWALGGDLYSPRDLFRRLEMHAADATPLDWPWIRKEGITSREELVHWAEIHRPEILTEARQAMECESVTGYRDWYDWQIHNWGCKWGCCEFAWQSDDHTAFYMETPWSPPEPIFVKLIELFPTLTFFCRFIDEAMDYDERRMYTAQGVSMKKNALREHL